jgi:hypothetical protein
MGCSWGGRSDTDLKLAHFKRYREDRGEKKAELALKAHKRRSGQPMSQQGPSPRQGLDHRNPVAKLLGKVGFARVLVTAFVNFGVEITGIRRGLVRDIQYTALQVTIHITAFPPSDCISGRRTKGCVRVLHLNRDDTQLVTMIAENRAQSLKELCNKNAIRI